MIDKLTEMLYYKLIKITINAMVLINIIINVVVRYCGFLDLIIINKKLLFTTKFWLLQCYFLDIKQKLSTAFQLQTNGQTKR